MDTASPGPVVSIDPLTCRISRSEYENIAGSLFDSTTFEKIKDDQEMVSVDKIIALLNGRVDAFISYDWSGGAPTAHADTAKRTNDALRKKGIITWFANQKVEGDYEAVNSALVDAANSSRVALVFVSTRFMHTINNDESVIADELDNYFRLGLSYVNYHTKLPIIATVLDKFMSNPQNWDGEFLEIMQNSVVVDMTNERFFDAQIDLLELRIKEAVGVTVTHVLNALDQRRIAHRSAIMESKRVLLPVVKKPRIRGNAFKETLETSGPASPRWHDLLLSPGALPTLSAKSDEARDPDFAYHRPDLAPFSTRINRMMERAYIVFDESPIHSAAGNTDSPNGRKWIAHPPPSSMNQRRVNALASSAYCSRRKVVLQSPKMLSSSPSAKSPVASTFASSFGTRAGYAEAVVAENNESWEEGATVSDEFVKAVQENKSPAYRALEKLSGLSEADVIRSQERSKNSQNQYPRF